MKIVCDDKIPFIRPAVEQLADEAVFKAGRDITAADVRDADILLVRTRTRCDSQLLQGSRVQLVVTATIGYDHLDTRWMEEHAIQWSNCPGCNATSVGQYVRNSLLALQQQRPFRLADATVGVVGVGHVGTAVVAALEAAGVKQLLLNDPPRQAAGETAPGGRHWCSLQQLQAEADVITFHTPLTQQGPFPTEHLADDAFFAALQHQPVIINAARGGVVDEEALLAAMQQGLVRDVIIDTWEHEPDVSRTLLERAFIATPHIAGYSADGKANATRMTLARVCHFLGRPMDFTILPPSLPEDFTPVTDPVQQALQLYDPRADSSRLKAEPTAFERLRGDYPLRRESFN